MARANVEIVQAMAEAFNAGEFENALELLSPDIEYHELRGMPGAGEGVGVYRGRDELVRWLTEFLSEWAPGFQSRYLKVVGLDDTHVMTVEHWRGRGAKSGIPVDMRAVALHMVRDERIARIRYFRSEAEALEAAGVEA